MRLTEEKVLAATRATARQKTAAAAFNAICTDTRALTQGCLFVALEGERFDAHTFVSQAAKSGAAGAVVKAGKPVGETPAGFGLYEVPNTLYALGDLARAHRRAFAIPVGAVGGSNGKTTTKEMVGAILATRGSALKTEGNFNNEIGVPLTLFRLESSHVAAVIEMGMNHAGEMDRLAAIAEPDAGLITVVQPEHLEGLGSLEGVAAAEGELFRGLKPTATAVVNVDDALIVEQARSILAKKLSFGRASGAEVRLGKISGRGKQGLEMEVEYRGKTYPVRLGFLGDHNAMNATGAFALALALGYSPEQCVQGLEAAQPYARRLNVLDAPGGITVVDDCYNANPASMHAALETLKGLAQGGRAIAILGDMLELGPEELAEHASLGEFARTRAQVLAFYGPRSEKGYLAAKDSKAQSAHFLDVGQLMGWLKPQLVAGDVVLVKGSRGMRLERAVEALTGKSAGAAHG